MRMNLPNKKRRMNQNLKITTMDLNLEAKPICSVKLRKTKANRRVWVFVARTQI